MLIRKQRKADVREKTAKKRIQTEVKKTEKVQGKTSTPDPAPKPADLTETDSDVEIIKVETAPVNPDLVETESESDRE